MKTKLMTTTLLAAILVAACAPSAATPTAVIQSATKPASTQVDGDTTVLRFAVSGMGESQYSSLIESFQAENPGVYIKTVSIETTLGGDRPGAGWPEDAFLLLASAADVIGATATRAAVQQGAVLDLTSLLASDPTISKASFYPQLLESVKWDGGTWSLPVEATYGLLYYNKDLLDAAGIPYPQPGWSWDDFLSTARALTVREGDTTTQWGFVQTSFDPVTLVQAYAGPLVNAEADPPDANLDSDAVEAGVKWFTDLFAVHDVTPYDTQENMFFDQGQGPMMVGSGARLIAEGEAATWLATNNFFGVRDRGGQAQNVGVVPLPVSGRNQQSTPATVTGFSISSGTAKVDLAWKWITYLAQQQARQQARFGNRMSSTVPAMPSVAAAAGFWDGLDEPTTAALEYATQHAFVDNYDGTGYDAFTQAVRGVIESGSAVETAMADAQAQAETEIEAAVKARPTPVSNLAVAEEEEQALQAGAVMIQFGTGSERFGEQTLATLADQFSQEHPDVVVELKEPAGFRGDLGLAQMAAEYDCFQASPDLSSDEDLAAILSMDPFLEADPAIGPDDFYSSLLKQFTYQGQIWGLPGSATVSLITYNKDLFDAAGVAYPSPNWTLSQFLETAVALTHGEDENKQYGYVPSFSAVNDLIILLDRLGASPYDDSVDPPRLNFTNPKVVSAVRWYTGLTAQYGVAPVPDEGSDAFGPPGRSQSMDVIFQGRAAMWTGGGMGFGQPGGFVMFVGPGGGGRGGTQSQLNTGVVPYPTGPDSAQGSGFQSVTGYFISAETESREACWDWITFLSQQPNVGFGLPARISVAGSSAYRQQVGDEQADAYLASVSVGNQASFFQRLSNEANWLSIGLTFLSDAYDQIVRGEKTVEEALDEAQLNMDSFRTCVIAGEGAYDRSVIESCLGELP